MRILILRSRPNLKINLDAFALHPTDPAKATFLYHDNIFFQTNDHGGSLRRTFLHWGTGSSAVYDTQGSEEILYVSVQVNEDLRFSTRGSVISLESDGTYNIIGGHTQGENALNMNGLPTTPITDLALY